MTKSYEEPVLNEDCETAPAISVHYLSVSARIQSLHFPATSAILFTVLELGCTTVAPKPDPAISGGSQAENRPTTALKPDAPPVASGKTEPDQVPVAPPADKSVPRALQSRLPWVNPARCLPICNYDPAPQLVRVNNHGEVDAKGRYRVGAELQPALRELLQAAREAGHALRIESAFRSYDEQARLYTSIKEIGRAARPGHSEHQTGTTIDLHMPTGASISWLANNAADFAFALSYPPNKQRVTGYRPEPWHIRYVGREVALELRTSKLTLEELFRARPELGESGSCGDCPLPASHAVCGDISTAGVCTGSVLSWCYDGALAAVDCAVTSQRCGRSSPAAPLDCLAPEIATRTP